MASGKPNERVRLAAARMKMDLLKRAADRISFLIVASDYPEIDIEIEKSKVRNLCGELFPTRVWLYEMIYEARFRRLWEQFRKPPGSSWAE